MAASVAFWAWCALLSYPLLGENVNFAEAAAAYTTSATQIVYQVIGLAAFLSTMCLAFHSRFLPTIGRMNTPQLAILAVVFLSFGLQLHDGELATLTGIFYTALLLVTLLTLSVLWTLDPADFERCMGVASVILCSFGILAIAILGWPKDRTVGAIQPNLFAAPLLAAFIFSQFRPGALGLVVRILCLAMIALVSSRFALIGCMTALVLHKMTFDPLSPRKLAALIIAILAGILLWPQIVEILALDDSGRGLSSGFSGRDERWNLAMAAIADNPVGIGFKRALGDEAGHNGYLKLLLEFGVTGGGLIIFFLACSLAAAGIEASIAASKTAQQRRFDCARFGGLAGLSFGAFFQPQLLSLGDTFAMALLLLLFRPRSTPQSTPAPAAGVAPRPISGGYLRS
ncbi:hypothetical protein B5V03_32855 [Bradyrhizobium betae]|uniref:O-antigen ligase family protein n=2 Tax=Bradyrhizobium betae TaxID=244734 RepID=A0A4Q1UMZ3_9BRAD|nr:hypothetical protein B5V03_32855 [Bradyrhizobium betae]